MPTMAPASTSTNSREMTASTRSSRRCRATHSSASASERNVAGTRWIFSRRSRKMRCWQTTQSSVAATGERAQPDHADVEQWPVVEFQQLRDATAPTAAPPTDDADPEQRSAQHQDRPDATRRARGRPRPTPGRQSEVDGWRVLGRDLLRVAAIGVPCTFRPYRRRYARAAATAVPPPKTDAELAQRVGIRVAEGPADERGHDERPHQGPRDGDQGDEQDHEFGPRHLSDARSPSLRGEPSHAI
jgi:hypothetical protein